MHYERGAMSEAAREMAKRLARLRALKREVETLSERVAQLEMRAKGGRVVVAGLPFRRLETTEDFSEEMARLHERLARRQRESMEELGRLYAFIDNIPDPELRLIFTCRYIDGMTWLRVAYRIGHYDEQTPRKKHNAYLRRVCEGNASDAFSK